MIDSQSVGNNDQDQEIRFTDHVLESSAVLELILKIMTKGTLSTHVRCRPKQFCGDLVNAFQFAHKYDCQVIKQFIKVWLGDALRVGELAKVDIFFLASQMRYHELAACVVGQLHGRQARGLASVEVTGPWGGHQHPERLHLDDFTAPMWNLLPGSYLRGLYAAARQADAASAQSTFLQMVLEKKVSKDCKAVHGESLTLVSNRSRGTILSGGHISLIAKVSISRCIQLRLAVDSWTQNLNLVLSIGATLIKSEYRASPS